MLSGSEARCTRDEAVFLFFVFLLEWRWMMDDRGVLSPSNHPLRKKEVVVGVGRGVIAS